MTHHNRITASRIATCATPANDNEPSDWLVVSAVWLGVVLVIIGWAVLS